jgi:hypothetical protein
MYTGPNIVTNGLVLALDAANTKSYISGSTTWNDLSGNGNSGSLVNGPTFSSDNNGSIVFDGIDDYVLTEYSPNIQAGTGYSHNLYFKTTSATVGDGGSNRIMEVRNGGLTGSPLFSIMVNWVSNNTVICLARGTDAFRRDLIVNNVTVNDGTWRNLHVQILPNGNTEIYINGVISGVYVYNTQTTINPQIKIPIGARNLEGSFSSFFSGMISNVKIYNRALTEAEIQQNYNGQKSRFNL